MLVKATATPTGVTEQANASVGIGIAVGQLFILQYSKSINL